MLQAVTEGCIQMNGGVKHLQSIDVVKHGGSYGGGYGAELGPYGKPLIAELERHQNVLWEAEE